MTLFLFRLDGTVIGYSAQGSKIPRKARAHHSGDLSRWVGSGFMNFRVLIIVVEIMVSFITHGQWAWVYISGTLIIVVEIMVSFIFLSQIRVARLQSHSRDLYFSFTAHVHESVVDRFEFDKFKVESRPRLTLMDGLTPKWMRTVRALTHSVAFHLGVSVNSPPVWTSRPNRTNSMMLMMMMMMTKTTGMIPRLWFTRVMIWIRARPLLPHPIRIGPQHHPGESPMLVPSFIKWVVVSVWLGYVR